MLLVVLGAVILVSIAITVTLKGKVAPSLNMGDMAPQVNLNDLSGKRVAIPADLKGKVVLIHFWLSTCTFCVKEICTIESYYRRHGTKVAAFSVNAGEDKGAAERYVAHLKVSYPILLDPGLSMTRLYGVAGVPTTYILDRSGVVRHKIIGEINADKLDTMAGSLL